MSDEIKKIQAIITPILKSHNVKRAALFGSVARGDNTKKSDVDIFVELKSPIGLFAFAKLNYSLADALHKKVDLVLKKAIKPILKKNILKDAIYIYESK